MAPMPLPATCRHRPDSHPASQHTRRRQSPCNGRVSHRAWARPSTSNSEQAMKKLTIHRVVGALTFVTLMLPAVAAEQPWVTKSNGNAKLLLQVMAKYGPEGASSLGVDGFDEQITDLSRDLFEPANQDTRAAVAELQKRLKAETDPK